MVDDIKTDGAIIVGLSVRMVVKGEEQNKEGKTSDQKQGNASTSQARRRRRGFPPFGVFSQG
jgi:hypothetical protein